VISEAQGARLTLTVSAAMAAAFLWTASSRHQLAYPPMTASLRNAQTELQDVASVALGMRRLGADLAWVQTLQYYGTPEEGQSESDFENGIGTYPRFLELCKRTSGIDPYFTFVYYYGGGVLGWNLNRPDEAEELLKAGIAANPAEWRLPQYLAGLAYQKDHDLAKLTLFLESVTSDPQCPLMMKALLANLYKKQKAYGKAISMWQTIYQAGDPDYMRRAQEQFRDIHRLLQTSRP
jgi:tetratricopeptide (TPR) repeat protein